QEILDRIVAIKMLQAHYVSDSHSVKRFQQEGKATCKLNHPHIITVFDFGISQHGGQPFIVMDYLQGIPLSEVIKQEGQVSVDRAVKIFIQAAEALGHAHKQGVVHRDLKPSNIVLINYDGDKDFVKVVDFGVAQIIEERGVEGQRLTQMGEVCGSPVYMSPEQCQGTNLDHRSDIYSMGVVMYETLTNRLPLLGKTMVETMRRHMEERPPPLSQVRPDLYIPERVERVIMRALEKKPEARFDTMEQLASELELAIPRPGRSQVLRTAPLEPEAEKESVSSDLSNMFMKMTMAHWAAIVVGLVIVVACSMGVAFLLTKKGTETEAAKVTSPGAVDTADSAKSLPGPAVKKDSAQTKATEPGQVKESPTSSGSASTASTTSMPPVVKSPPPTVPSAAKLPTAAPTKMPVRATAVKKPPKPKAPKPAVKTVESKPSAARKADPKAGDRWNNLLKDRSY
ncbi:MAG: protein kinase, partial [Cyanobacteria bacterium]|nr:protein kinase [Cyanobacteriota bacterium]